MELLMGNLRAALRGKGEPAEQCEEEKNRAGLKELSAIAIKILAVLAVSFIAARVPFFYVMYPGGVALLTVLMARGRGAIYALLPMLAGMVSAQGTSPTAIGSVVTTLACGTLFFLLRKKKISLTSRALLAAGICVVGKTAVSIAFHTFYTYDGFSVLGEGLLVLFFVFVFSGFFSLIEKENPVQPVSANIFILTVVGLMLTGGVLPQVIGSIAPMNVAALFIVLLTGYRLGVMEGATAGVAAGLMLFGIANQGPAIMGILACGGMAAGLLRGENRLYAATCFCAVCLSFGFLKGYPSLYMTVYEPAISSLIFLVMPRAFLEKADQILAKAGRDDAYYELLEKNRILSVLQEYRETFSYLALVYGPGKDGKRIPRRSNAAGTDATTGKKVFFSGMGTAGKEERSGRTVASYQFAGIACAVDGMMKELRQVERPVLIKEERFKVKLGTAGYARCEGISGDSTLCNHIRKGEYLLALADGMGKGEKAAQESNLTLNTLYNLMRAGFEPELALRMINSLLLMKSTEEIFSTVDMGLINLYTGRLRMFKIGAATTFIKRGDKVETVKASSLPLGMVEKISVDSIEISLRKGDQIIIVSDGITEADRGKVRSSAAADFIESSRTGNVVSFSQSGDVADETSTTHKRKEVSPQLGRTGTEWSGPTMAAATAGTPTAATTVANSKNEMDWSAVSGMTMKFPEKKSARKKKEEEQTKFDWTLPVCEEEDEEAAAMAERIKIRNSFNGQRAMSESAPRSREVIDIHEDWLKETIAQIKSTDPQTVSDLILNRAVEQCGLKEKDDMTVITAYIS